MIQQQERLSYVYPALIATLISGLAYMTLGSTPPLRALALALVVAAISLMLRGLGPVLAISGSLVFGFCPAFWSQTGGSPIANEGLILTLIALAAIGGVVGVWQGGRLLPGVVLGAVVFVVPYAIIAGSTRSLRLTTLLAAWLLYALVLALRRTNPRPEEAPAQRLGWRHTLSIAVLLSLGVLNDPLLTLMVPVVAIGLWLSHAELPWWYWAWLLLLVLLGGYGVFQIYVRPDWINRSAAELLEANLSGPFIVFDGWREPMRWVSLLQLTTQQFTLLGAALGVVGLARIARWYPTLGVITMVMYGVYAVFGLMYFGLDANVLLLPMLMVQVFWTTYAVYALGQWLQKTSQPASRWLAPAAFTLLPLVLLARILMAQ